MNQELSEAYLVDKVAAALEEDLLPLAVRRFFPLADGEDETPELRARMANIKARLVVGKIAELMKNGLEEDGFLQIANFVHMKGSNRLENKLAGKPTGPLYPLSVYSGPVKLSQIVTRRTEAVQAPGNYHGEPLAESYLRPDWDYVQWSGGTSPGLGGNNGDSAVGYFRVKVKNAVVLSASYDGVDAGSVTKDLLSWVLVRGYLSLAEGGSNIKLQITDGAIQQNILAMDTGGGGAFFLNSGGWSAFENTKISDYEAREIDDNPAFGVRAAKAFCECYPRERKVVKIPVGSAGNYRVEPIKWVGLAEYQRLYGQYKDEITSLGFFWPPEDRQETKAQSRLSVSFAPEFVKSVNELLVINNP